MNEWSLLSTEQEEIVVLNAKITQLEQANKPKCKTKEDNKSKGQEKDNKNNNRNLLERRKQKTTTLIKLLGRKSIIGAYIIMTSKDNGSNINQMSVITSQTKKKSKKKVSKPNWQYLSIQKTARMKNNDGYARVASSTSDSSRLCLSTYGKRLSS